MKKFHFSPTLPSSSINLVSAWQWPRPFAGDFETNFATGNNNSWNNQDMFDLCGYAGCGIGDTSLTRINCMWGI